MDGTLGVSLVQHLQEVLALNERTLRRRCHDIFGYGPKTLDRILRFQRFLQLARARGTAGMAAVAAEAGYADQSHLCRELRRYTGLSPQQLWRCMPNDEALWVYRAWFGRPGRPNS